MVWGRARPQAAQRRTQHHPRVPVVQRPRTPPFQGENTGSNPVGDAKFHVFLQSRDSTGLNASQAECLPVSTLRHWPCLYSSPFLHSASQTLHKRTACALIGGGAAFVVGRQSEPASNASRPHRVALASANEHVTEYKHTMGDPMLLALCTVYQIYLSWLLKRHVRRGFWR